MANNVQGKNVQGVIFLRNGSPYANHDAALSVLKAQTMLNRLNDGEMALARYISDQEVKTLVGVMYKPVEGTPNITIFDVEGASADVEKLRQEINAKLGTSFISSGNTVEANLTALSGNSSTDTSATTSVEGAKKYAYDLLGTLDYTDTAVAGSYVSEVTQSDGKIISTTKVALPSVTGEVESKKVVMSVSEDKGEISVDKGTIESADKTVVISDVTDASDNVTGVDFKVNIDNETLIADTGTGVISVASAALTQYVGDEDTIHISDVDANNKKTISSYLTIQKVTTGLSEEVKEEYHLIGHSGTTIGDPVKIYKDSHIVSITYITDTGDTHYQNLEYVYIDASGNTQTTYVDMSELVLEAEFASGLTIENHVARGVVDPQSEKDSQDTPVDFLTVGADGFKVSGIKDEIDRKINALDATGGTQTIATDKHVAVEVVEANGLITAVTVTEDNIADADDLEELSAKTVTEIASSNASIAVSTATTTADDGTVKYDVITDASKIQMSGFTTTTGNSLSGIAESDSIVDAFEEVDEVITQNERITAAALNDLNDKIDNVSGASLSGVSVNGFEVTRTGNVSEIGISGATSAATPTSTEAIVVNVNESTGAITLGLGYIDCGTYDDQPEP